MFVFSLFSTLHSFYDSHGLFHSSSVFFFHFLHLFSSLHFYRIHSAIKMHFATVKLVARVFFSTTVRSSSQDFQCSISIILFRAFNFFLQFVFVLFFSSFSFSIVESFLFGYIALSFVFISCLCCKIPCKSTMNGNFQQIYLDVDELLISHENYSRRKTKIRRKKTAATMSVAMYDERNSLFANAAPMIS